MNIDGRLQGADAFAELVDASSSNRCQNPVELGQTSTSSGAQLYGRDPVQDAECPLCRVGGVLRSLGLGEGQRGGRPSRGSGGALIEGDPGSGDGLFCTAEDAMGLRLVESVFGFVVSEASWGVGRPGPIPGRRSPRRSRGRRRRPC